MGDKGLTVAGLLFFLCPKCRDRYSAHVRIWATRLHWADLGLSRVEGEWGILLRPS